MNKIHPPKIFYSQHPVFSEKNFPLKNKSIFTKAVAQGKNLNIDSDTQISIRLYSLYKQATVGDINISLPGNIPPYVETAKIEAWASLKGKLKKEARNEFIILVKQLKQTS